MQKIAEQILRARKAFLILWIFLLVILGYFALQITSVLEGDGFRTDGEFEEVREQLTDSFDFPETSLLVLFERNEHESEEDFEAKIEQTTAYIGKQLPEADVQSPLEENNMRKNSLAYAAIQLEEEPADIGEVIEELRAFTSDYQGVTLTGEPVITEDINKASQNDLKRAELIGLPIALVVLLFAFGSVVASIVPIIVGGITVVGAFGLLYHMAGFGEMSIFLLNVVPMIGLALSIDFSLLFINRYREELLTRNKEEAIKRTIETAGESILFSAVCVFIGLGAMAVIQVDIFQTIALGGMVVITFAVLGTMTLLPAILHLLGPLLNKWQVINPRHSAVERWRKFARWVMKYPVLITIAATAVLVVGLLPVQNMNLSIPSLEALPADSESRIAYETIEDELIEEGRSTAYVLAERPDGWLDEDGLSQYAELIERLEESNLINSIDSLFSVSDLSDSEELHQALQQDQTRSQLEPAIDQFTEGDQLLIPVHLTVEEASSEAQNLMRDWISEEWPVPVEFGGRPKFNQEIYDEIYNKIGISLAIILISTYVILMFAFRSVLIPLKAILMNILGLAAAFGVLVFLFQGGHLGLEQTDISLMLPVIVFSLVFGLSMDYEVFLISRIYEFHKQTGDNTYSTIEGLANTSKIITSAALIMIVITGAFAFTDVMPVKQIGIGIAIAIFIDASIIRLFLVPSLMKLLGEWNWWFPLRRKPKSHNK